MSLFQSERERVALAAYEASEDLYFAVNAQGIVRGSCNAAALNALSRYDTIFPVGGLETLLRCQGRIAIAEVDGHLGGIPAFWYCRALPGTNKVLVRCSTREAALRNAARVDPLTGLANYRQFTEDLIAHRNETGLTALLFIDVDHFKAFNDEFGHQVGDEVLRSVGKEISRHLRPDDQSYRYGGEEFAYRMEGLIRSLEFSRGIVYARAEAIRKGIAALEAPRQITVSIGVAIWPSSEADGPEFVKEADEALYHAKRTGRNRVVMSDTLPARSALTTST